MASLWKVGFIICMILQPYRAACGTHLQSEPCLCNSQAIQYTAMRVRLSKIPKQAEQLGANIHHQLELRNLFLLA